MSALGTRTRRLRLRSGRRGPARRGGAAPGPSPAGERPRLHRLRRLSPANWRPARVALVVAVVAVLGGLGAGGWLWLRDSSLVAVQRVEISGLSGPDAGQIRGSLVAAARGMTTLDVHLGRLHAAVSAFPVVKRLRVSAQFPHGMRIHVTEQVPVGVVALGGHAVPVGADGTLLRDEAPGALPSIAVAAPPGGASVQDPAARSQLAVLAAAPAPLLGRITGTRHDYWHGVVVQLRQGPALYFGTADALAAKWRAALAVLATADTAGAAYIDVSDPDRPAAGPGGGAATALAAMGVTGG